MMGSPSAGRGGAKVSRRPCADVTAVWSARRAESPYCVRRPSGEPGTARRLGALSEGAGPGWRPPGSQAPRDRPRAVADGAAVSCLVRVWAVSGACLGRAWATSAQCLGRRRIRSSGCGFWSVSFLAAYFSRGENPDSQAWSDYKTQLAKVAANGSRLQRSRYARQKSPYKSTGKKNARLARSRQRGTPEVRSVTVSCLQ